MSGVGFERDIKPLFLPFHRSAMLFAFDLWRREDVAANVSMILERLQVGDMPCDRSWPNEHVALFRDLMKMGHRP